MENLSLPEKEINGKHQLVSIFFEHVNVYPLIASYKQPLPTTFAMGVIARLKTKNHYVHISLLS